MKNVVSSLTLVLLLSSCATAISGRTQEIKLTSNPDTSDCSYSNDRSSGTVRTPGTMQVERSKKTLEVTCSIQGYGTGTEKIEPGANYWLLANVANFGIGYFYDVYDGSSWDYPHEVHVVVQPTGGMHEGNFMMRGYGNGAVQPSTGMPVAPTQAYPVQGQQGAVQNYGTYGATQQQQVSQPQSQGQLMADIMRDRESITSDTAPEYKPPVFDQQPAQAQYQPAQYQQPAAAASPTQAGYAPQPQTQQEAYELFLRQKHAAELAKQQQMQQGTTPYNSTQPMMPNYQMTPRMP